MAALRCSNIFQDLANAGKMNGATLKSAMGSNETTFKTKRWIKPARTTANLRRRQVVQAVHRQAQRTPF